MPTSEATPHFSVAQRKKLARAQKMGLPLPQPSWGEFNKLRAILQLRSKLTSNAQHVALILATMTPEDGVVEVTHKELAELTGRGHNTVAAALKECEAAGFLCGKRTIGTFVYAWSEKAYQRARSMHSCAFMASGTCADEQNPTDLELDGATLDAYKVAWSHKYQMACTDVFVDANGLARARVRIVDITNRRQTQGETYFAAFARTALDMFSAWMARDGHDGSKWLAERFHPLQCFVDGTRTNRNADMDYASRAVLLADKEIAKRAEQKRKALETVQTHVVGPRGVGSVGAKAFVAMLPRAVQAEMGAS